MQISKVARQRMGYFYLWKADDKELFEALLYTMNKYIESEKLEMIGKINTVLTTSGADY